MRLYPKKDHWLNIPGQKKLRTLTKGKAYAAAVWEVHGKITALLLVNDQGVEQTFYKESDFVKSDSMRVRKLNLLGI
jgi:fructose-1,6-bisphosphatase